MKTIPNLLLFAVLLLSAQAAAQAQAPLDTDAAVLKSVSEVLRVSPAHLKPEQSFARQAARGDTLDIIEVITTLEEELDISISGAALGQAMDASAPGNLSRKLTIKKLQEAVRTAYAQQHGK